MKDKVLESQIQLCIGLLEIAIPSESKSIADYELLDWIPNGIKCLQFALDNEVLLKEQPSLYQDTLGTISLIHAWVTDADNYSYIILRKKFQTTRTPEEVGNAFKSLLHKMQTHNSKINDSEKVNNLIDVIDEDGNFKSTYEVLNELSVKWNEIN